MARRTALFDIPDGAAVHKSVELIRDSDAHIGVRSLLEEAWQSFPSPDPNFVAEFQGAGFDARVWELYLLMALREAGCDVDRIPGGLDFRASRDGIVFHVEAATAASGRPYAPRDSEDVAVLTEGLRNFTAGKLAAVFHNKRKKRYERRPSLKGEALVLAVAPFFGVSGHSMSESALIPVLWGVDFDRNDARERPLPEIRARPVPKIDRGGKTISAGLFLQPGMEPWSGVLYSSEGTIAKFHRRDAQVRHTSGHRVLRAGFFHDHNDLAIDPVRFAYEVGVNGPTETWCQGLSISHNPRAHSPLPRGLLRGVADHAYCSDSRTSSIIPDYHPYGTRTLVAAWHGLWVPWSQEEIFGRVMHATAQAIAMEGKSRDV